MSTVQLPSSGAESAPLHPAIVGVQRDHADRFCLALFLLLGIALMATNRWFGAVDDEVAIIDRAAQPVSHTVRMFLSGVGEHEHPPLWDLILHGWLRITDGRLELLRLLPVAFYLLGAWGLAKAARRLGGAKSQMLTAAVIVLWPYGFHFGRLAAWYSFSFFLVAMLTWAYLNYINRRTATAWTGVFIAALALVYCNYFGWALLLCIALDSVWVNRASFWGALKSLALTAGLMAVAYLPVAAAFLREARVGSKIGFSLQGAFVTSTYNLYALCASESVAPWVWIPGIIAGCAICIALGATLIASPPAAKRLLIYFICLLLTLTFLGVISTKRIMLMGPWLLLPVAVALGTLSAGRLRQVLVAALVVIGSIGWYGIFARDLYAAPRWAEPWRQVAQQAAGVVQGGGIAIGDNPSFFFYLTYLLPPPNPRNHAFEGLLPYSVHRKSVYTPQKWLESGRPLGNKVIFTKGVHYGMNEAPIGDSERWLDQNCELTSDDRYVRELGKKWKDAYSPQAAQPVWRVEVRQYACRLEKAAQKH